MSAPGEPADIYVRISKDRTGAGLGVGQQEGDCRALGAQLGCYIRKVYVDNDTEASSGKPRKAYRAMLAGLAASPAHVLVWHNDRLHRRPVELEEYIELVERHGILTHTVKAGQFDLATPSGRLVARLLGAAARYEIEHQIERMQARQLQAAAAGRWHGGPRPFGFEADGVTIRIPEATAVISGSMAVLSGASLQTVKRDWNTAGLLSARGSQWDASGVRRMLIRARNAGLRQHQECIAGHAEWGRWMDGAQTTWGCLVSEDDWRGVVAILTSPARRTGPGPARRWLGSGLYLCGVCGGRLTCRTAGQQRPVYSCSDPKGAGKQHVARSAQYVDTYVTELVLAWMDSEHAADLRAMGDEIPGRESEIAALHITVAALHSRLSEQVALHADGAIDAAQLKEGSELLHRRLEEAEQAIAALSQRSALAGVVKAADPAAAWDELDLRQKQAVVARLMTVTINPAPSGRPPGTRRGTTYFRPEYVRIGWKTARAGQR